MSRAEFRSFASRQPYVLSKANSSPTPTPTLAPARRADLNDGALLFAVISGNLATSLAGGREQNEQDKHL